MRKIKNTLSIVNCPLSIIIAALLIFAASCGETSASKQTSPENNAGAMPDQSYVEAWYLDESRLDELIIFEIDDSSIRFELGFYRLLGTRGTAKIENDEIVFTTDADISGTMKFNENGVLLTVTQSEFPYIDAGAIYDFTVKGGEKPPLDEPDNDYGEYEYGDYDFDQHPITVQLDKTLDEVYSTVDICEAYGNAAEAWKSDIDKIYSTLTLRFSADICHTKLQAAQKAWEEFNDEDLVFNAGFWSLFSGTMYYTFSAYYPVYAHSHRAYQLLNYYSKNALYSSYFDENTEVKTEEEWDKALNDNYKALMGKLNKENQERLKAAQRKWIVYRDAEDDCYNSCCLLILNPDYRANLIRERALRLKKYVEDYSNHKE